MNKATGKVGHNMEDFPLLSSGQLYVWSVNTNPTAELLERCKVALSEHELTRIPFFKFEQVQQNYIISQGVLRLLLGAYLGMNANKLKIGRQAKGKPISSDDPDIHFNISNSGKMAVYAFSRDSEVGIDLEHIRQIPDLDEMITKNFSTNERKYINASEKDRNSRFFRFWTIKESYLKAIGEGMRLAPDNLEFSIEKDGITHLSTRGVFELEDWIFKEFSPATDYVGTLTFMQKNSSIEYMKFV